MMVFEQMVGIGSEDAIQLFHKKDFCPKQFPEAFPNLNDLQHEGIYVDISNAFLLVYSKLIKITLSTSSTYVPTFLTSSKNFLKNSLSRENR